MEMQADFTLQGPKVYAQREGTADAGGGQIYAGAGQLAVQGAVRGRQLGSLNQLASVRFHDHRGRDSEWTFADGTRWVLRCDNDALLRFSHELASGLRRPDMVRESLSPQAQLWSETKARQKELMLAAGCALLALPVHWLVSHAPWLGYLLVVIGLCWLLAATAARMSDHLSAGAVLSQVLHPLKAWSWVLSWVLPSALILGALIGIAMATERAREAAVAAQRDAAQAATEAAEREAQAARAAALSRQIDDKLAAMTTAINEERFEDAASLHAEAAGLAPDSEKVLTAGTILEPKLQASRQRRRAADARAGVSLARQVTADRVLCETAQAVGDAWGKLQQTRPDDATYEAAKKLAGKLEQCRKRVVAVFSANARAAAAQGRAAWGDQLELELRKQGLAASVRLEGNALRKLVVSVERLDEASMATLLGEAVDLKARASEQGIARIELRAGKRKRRFRLSPRRADMTQVLSPFGLAKPIAL